VVADILEGLGYSLQLNQKMLQAGEGRPDRNGQFEFINGKAKRFLEAGDPVVSIDAKKKEDVGNFINNGKSYNKSKSPTKALGHDFPPGTSKRNKIEHRMFCYISSHWRGQPLVSVEAVIALIGSTTTTAGLKITCVKDEQAYELGVKVSDEDLARVNIKNEPACPSWNYSISPRK
jgi:hypothetical protein